MNKYTACKNNSVLIIPKWRTENLTKIFPQEEKQLLKNLRFQTFFQFFPNFFFLFSSFFLFFFVFYPLNGSYSILSTRITVHWIRFEWIAKYQFPYWKYNRANPIQNNREVELLLKMWHFLYNNVIIILHTIVYVYSFSPIQFVCVCVCVCNVCALTKWPIISTIIEYSIHKKQSNIFSFLLF